MEDSRLIKQVLAGNRQAFAPLVEKYGSLVYTSALKIVRDSSSAQDVAQEALWQAYRSLGDYRGEAAFTTWLTRIAINKALDHCRRANPLQEKSREDSADFWSPGPEEAVIRGEQLGQLREKVEGLPNIYRQVIFDHYYSQLTYQEIAVRNNVSVKTVESRIYRAKLMLKTLMTGGGPGEQVSSSSRT